MVSTRQELFLDTAETLRQARVRNAELDARLLVCNACEVSFEDLVCNPKQPVTACEVEKLGGSVNRRLAGEPVSRIVGYRAFWKSNFKIGPDTLDPRPDTETVIETALAIAKLENWQTEEIRILDLGTGSGCILVSLLCELENAHGVGVDISSQALEIAQSNAKSMSVDARTRFFHSDWLNDVPGRYHLIVSNPPYIAEDDIADLDTEVSQFEPVIALNGGRDGLSAYRAIIPEMKYSLRQGGWAVFEVGDEQGHKVLDILKSCGYKCDDPYCCHGFDLSNRLRVVAGKLQTDVVR